MCVQFFMPFFVRTYNSGWAAVNAFSQIQSTSENSLSDVTAARKKLLQQTKLLTSLFVYVKLSMDSSVSLSVTAAIVSEAP